MARIVTKEFTSSGTWTCPAGVTKVLTIGCGGGAGGSGDGGGLGGGGSEAVLYVLDVIPNTSYTITIGAGGAGGDPFIYGGNPTSFGSLATWAGATYMSGVGSTQYMDDGWTGNCCGGGNVAYEGGPSNRFNAGISDNINGLGSGGAGGFGDGADAHNSSDGDSAAANTGAGGGAGGSGFNGGAGGSGYLQIIWSE